MHSIQIAHATNPEKIRPPKCGCCLLYQDILMSAKYLATLTFVLATMAAAAFENASGCYQKLYSQLCKSAAGIFLMDGGTGEELFAQGVPDDRQHWSTTALIQPEYHTILQKVHQSYLRAGSQAITTNSYGIVPALQSDKKKYKSCGDEQLLTDVAKYAQLSGQIAQQAVEQHLQETASDSNSSRLRPLILGSLGPLVESYRADMVLDPKEGVPLYRVLVQSLTPYVNVILGETLSSIDEAKLVVEAVASEGKTFPLWISFSLNESGQFRDKEAVNRGINTLLDYCEKKGVQLHAILFNCATPEAIRIGLEVIQNDQELLQRFKEQDVLLGAYANRLTPVAADWTLESSTEAQPFRDEISPQSYSKIVTDWADNYNLQLLGGCCGISPLHIEAIHNSLTDRIIKES